MADEGNLGRLVEEAAGQLRAFSSEVADAAVAASSPEHQKWLESLSRRMERCAEALAEEIGEPDSDAVAWYVRAGQHWVTKAVAGGLIAGAVRLAVGDIAAVSSATLAALDAVASFLGQPVSGSIAPTVPPLRRTGARTGTRLLTTEDGDVLTTEDGVPLAVEADSPRSHSVEVEDDIGTTDSVSARAAPTGSTDGTFGAGTFGEGTYGGSARRPGTDDETEPDEDSYGERGRTR